MARDHRVPAVAASPQVQMVGCYSANAIAPSSSHIRSGLVPGLAHVAYWKDKPALRYVLSRTYGKAALHDRDYRPLHPVVRGSIAILSYFIWAGTLGALAYYAITKLWPWIVDGGLFAWNLLKL